VYLYRVRLPGRAGGGSGWLILTGSKFRLSDHPAVVQRNVRRKTVRTTDPRAMRKKRRWPRAGASIGGLLALSHRSNSLRTAGPRFRLQTSLLTTQKRSKHHEKEPKATGDSTDFFHSASAEGGCQKERVDVHPEGGGRHSPEMGFSTLNKFAWIRGEKTRASEWTQRKNSKL